MKQSGKIVDQLFCL